MNDEKIESVLMDYVLGSVSGDVAALVEAYVAQNDEARAALAQWRDVTGLAKRALKEKTKILPTFPREAIHQAHRGKRLQIVGWIAGMAACVAVGFFVGLRHGAEGGVERSRIVAQLPAGPAMSAEKQSDNGGAVKDFWSMSRLREVAMKDRRVAADVKPSFRFGGLQ